MSAGFIDFAGKTLVALILWSIVGMAVAMALGDAQTTRDFAFSLTGATLTLLAVEVFAARLAR